MICCVIFISQIHYSSSSISRCSLWVSKFRKGSSLVLQRGNVCLSLQYEYLLPLLLLRSLFLRELLNSRYGIHNLNSLLSIEQKLLYLLDLDLYFFQQKCSFLKTVLHFTLSILKFVNLMVWLVISLEFQVEVSFFQLQPNRLLMLHNCYLIFGIVLIYLQIHSL